MKALSIQQPWAWLIAAGVKSVENRTWRTNYRGPVMIHAGKTIDHDAWREIMSGVHPLTGRKIDVVLPSPMPVGGIVGEMEIVDCVHSHASDWFCGPWAFVLANARPLPFMACRGHLGFFEPDFDVRIATVPISLDLFQRGL